MTDRDLANVRLVGAFALVFGIVLLLLTLITSFFLILATSTNAGSQITRGLTSVAIAVIMAISLVGCGGTMRTVRLSHHADLENLRLVWTALVLMLLITGIASLWFVPPLADVAAIMLLALFAVRGAVIRLTNQ